MSEAGIIVLATQNAKKGRELQDLTRDRYQVKTLADLGLHPDIVEDQDTFEGNARRKVEQVVDALARSTAIDLHEVRCVLADDSGIVVDALNGAPGVRSARFAADHAAGEGDAANNALLLKQLADVPDAQRQARFACAICVMFLPDRSLRGTFATVEGRIAFDELGTGGFGYDPLFLPDAYPGRRMAELSAEEKHAVSHRGKAVREALTWLSD